ncbi:MtrB/PioB family decaheme-associated outer membrane protein [Ferrimonas gelatinilytica]|uniref:MtrB/PioB family decaheme-associated outer membrane protein n=1 Tax=Ferrimonas gelatinilytica TaxID=1255257 RepID=A0ABP9SEJ3_9GAMM
MKLKFPKLVSALTIALAPSVLALDFSLDKANTANVKWEGWECKNCKPVSGSSGHFQIGVVDTNTDDIHSANTLGTDKDGLSMRLGADINHWGEHDTRWILSAKDLGLDIASLAASVSRAKNFSAALRYRAMARWDATVYTPFAVNSNRFTLPDDWVRGATTPMMTDLNDALGPKDLKVERDHFGLALDKHFDDIRVYLDLEQQQRRGNKRASSSLLTNSVALPERVDDHTTNYQIGLNATGGLWQVAFGYQGSRYRNDAAALVWDNPYSATFGSAFEGRQSVAPDNDADQVFGRATWTNNRHLFSGQVVWGRHRQDDDLIPATINGPSPALPTDSADLKLDKLDADLRYRVRLTDRASLHADYGYQDRDYRHPLYFYPQVITDSITRPAELALYPDKTEQQAGLKFSYRFARGISADFGYRYQRDEWENQQADSADTNRYYAKLRLKRWQKVQVWLEVAEDQRRTNGFSDSLDLNGIDNDEALRQYHLADRDQTEGKLMVQYQPLERLNFQFTLDGQDQDYQSDAIGLDEVQRYGYDIHATWYQDSYHLYLFYNDYKTKTRQNGSNISSRWQALQDDDAESVGLGFEYSGLEESSGLTFGLDAVYADSDGLTQLEQGVIGRYDDISSERTTLDAYVRYRVNEHSSVQLDFLMQDYEDSNYLYSGLSADSIGNVLFFPDFSHDYSDTRIGLSYRHDF